MDTCFCDILIYSLLMATVNQTRLHLCTLPQFLVAFISSTTQRNKSSRKEASTFPFSHKHYSVMGRKFPRCDS